MAAIQFYNKRSSFFDTNGPKVAEVINRHVNSTVAITDAELGVIVENPATCGYLRAFMEQQFNAENLMFVMAVEEYCDHFTKTELSNRMTPEKYQQKADHIWENFIANSAPNQVSLDSKTYNETKENMDKPTVHLFDGAKQLCLITVRRDVFPRFRVSELMTELDVRLHKTLEDCPDLEAPHGSISLDRDLTHCTGFELDEVLNDRFLFGAFLKYLEDSVCAENLMCYQEIQCFKKAVQKKDNVERAKDIAWKIYAYFVHNPSPYQISTSFLTRKQIAYLLASPKVDMFDEIERSTFNVIKMDHFRKFKKSVSYVKLPDIMRQHQASLVPKSMFCFCVPMRKSKYRVTPSATPDGKRISKTPSLSSAGPPPPSKKITNPTGMTPAKSAAV
eukprot:TRINITY_DN3114_c0_g1_i5.p1 TRINITY_DN3114_c0_g1~~TRINITY_DN3114_c0_g1_i5.p1  ORF type:complete len:390 (-),score=104.10 TRINITY_DN3114_c0_g1_i5:861-2030(-)